MQTLIDKYFEGQTTLKEEITLQEYFKSGQVSAEHLPYLPLFQFIKNEQEVALSNDFEEKLFQEIEQKEKNGKIRRLPQRLFKIAALFLIIMGAWLLFQEITRPKTIDWAKYEIKDPKKAFETTKAALIFASKKLNNGTHKAAKQTKNLSKIQFNYLD